MIDVTEIVNQINYSFYILLFVDCFITELKLEQVGMDKFSLHLVYKYPFKTLDSDYINYFITTMLKLHDQK